MQPERLDSPANQSPLDSPPSRISSVAHDGADGRLLPETSALPPGAGHSQAAPRLAPASLSGGGATGAEHPSAVSAAEVPASPASSTGQRSDSTTASTFGVGGVPLLAGHVPRATLTDLPNEVLTHVFSHLPPTALTDVASVCRRFHDLVTSPHAWRLAFSRHFLGPASLRSNEFGSSSDAFERLVSQRRSFTRLSPRASWRSEYVLRCRLLRALSKGKPGDMLTRDAAADKGSLRAPSSHGVNAVTTFRAHTLYPVTHIDASFTSASGRKQALLIHGADEEGVATTSNPLAARSGGAAWAAHADRSMLFRRFNDVHPHLLEYGMGEGSIVGVPNCMDVSQQFGYVYGEGVPPGRLFFQCATDPDGLWLEGQHAVDEPHLAAGDSRSGVPDLRPVRNMTSVTALWLAKSPNVPRLSHGVVGLLAGFSTGVLAAYSLGPSPHYAKKYAKGQPTAKWAVCPGVPIISIKVDDSCSEERLHAGRLWVVVVNALGEVFYLKDMPTPLPGSPSREASMMDMTETTPAIADRGAWITGRTVQWHRVTPSTRIVREDAAGLYSLSLDVEPGRTPCSSSHGQQLSDEAVAAQTRDIEKWSALAPIQIREIYEGWDMRRRVEVDFAGTDGAGAGENVIVIQTGWMGTPAEIKRYTRTEALESVASDPCLTGSDSRQTLLSSGVWCGAEGLLSSFPAAAPAQKDVSSGRETRREEARSTKECWLVTDLEWAQKGAEVTASSIDCSTIATLTPSEDAAHALASHDGTPAVSPSKDGHPSRARRTAQSAGSFSTAMAACNTRSQHPALEIPGQRGRLFAIGNSAGTVVIWDIRAHTGDRTPGDHASPVRPVGVIHTDSPEIASLALTSLYLVHGGNDGLVQAWDPLMSTTRPIRTLNSRFSSKARRYLQHAEEQAQVIGTNWFAANAIALDPDPCSLAGVVALGSHLRFWAYSFDGPGGGRYGKRRSRPGLHRHIHSPGVGENGAGSSQNRMRQGMREYIASEELHMRLDAEERRRQEAVLSSRFGVDLLGPDADDDEVLAYAQFLSQEAHQRERNGQLQQTADASDGRRARSEHTPRIPGDIPADRGPDDNQLGLPRGQEAYSAMGSNTGTPGSVDDEDDADLAEALRLSLLEASETGVLSSALPASFERQPTSSPAELHYGSTASPSSFASVSQTPVTPAGVNSAITPTPADSSNDTAEEMDPDLAYAIQLSLAEEESRKQAYLGAGHAEPVPNQDLRWDAVGCRHDDDDFPSLTSGHKGKGRASRHMD
ncbi:hypothetical protein KEM52_005939 [Ascosphaera acerosa]|nr:hypothetical protein KEM52_005939 [Ascosphaera acerosa]